MMYQLEKQVSNILRDNLTRFSTEMEMISVQNQICNLIQDQLKVEDWRKSINLDIPSKRNTLLNKRKENE